MAKTIVIFETRYGNTRIVAENIALGIRKVRGNDVDVSDVKDVDVNTLNKYDAIVIGAPVHFGTITRKVGSLVNKLKTMDLKGKVVSFYDTYMPKDMGKGVKKLEDAASKIPGIRLIPGISVRVKGMKGPVAEEDLPLCVEHGVKIGERTIEPPPSA